MRRALILCIAIAALPAAPAAAWQEVPFRALPADEVATCLRATGSEGGLAALGPVGRRSAPTDLFAIGAGPPAVRERVRFRVVRECAAVREQGGAGIAAAPVTPLGRRTGEMRAAVRDPGGVFGAPVALGPMRHAYDAAVSARGDALVAWTEERDGGKAARVVAARRAPGGPFGAPVPLTPWRRATPFATPQVAAGLDRDGVATVAWALRSPGSGERDSLDTVEAASAPPGAAFGAAQLLTRRTNDVANISLAVAAGGAALLAHDGDEVLRVFERAPGATGFGPARELGEPGRPTSEAALALRDDGAAVVAWRGGAEEDAVHAMTRAAGGAFGADREVARGHRDAGFGTGFGAFLLPDPERAYAPLDQAGLGLRAAVSATGRVLLAWSAPRTLPDAPIAAVVATGTLDGAFGPPATLGSPARSVAGLAALVLPGGEPAVAWADNISYRIGFGAGKLEPPIGGGRIHLARADAAAGPPAPPPAARLSAARLQRLYPDEPIRVSVRCAAACDVRAFIPHDGATTAGGAASLPGGRTRVVLLARELVRRSAPTASRARDRAGSCLGAREHGDAHAAAARASGPAAAASGPAAAGRARGPPRALDRRDVANRVPRSPGQLQRRAPARPDEEPGSVLGRGRTRFKLTLRPSRPGTVRRLVIEGTDFEGEHSRKVTVRVTG